MEKKITVVKIKGVTPEALKNISVKDLYPLLIEGLFLEFGQSKWFKNIFTGEISVREQAYMLIATNNKRKPKYTDLTGNPKLFHSLKSKNRVLVYSGTRPYSYSEIEQKPISKDITPLPDSNIYNDI